MFGKKRKNKKENSRALNMCKYNFTSPLKVPLIVVMNKERSHFLLLQIVLGMWGDFRMLWLSLGTPTYLTSPLNAWDLQSDRFLIKGPNHHFQAYVGNIFLTRCLN